MSLYLGIDPGATGALAWLIEPAGEVICEDMPTRVVKVNGKNRTIVDPEGFDQVIARTAGSITACVLERVGPMKRMDAGAQGRFLTGYGVLIGILAVHRVPTYHLLPQQWRRMVGLPKKGEKDKKPSKAKADELFPDCRDQWRLVKDADRAEAALMAWCAYQRATEDSGGGTPSPLD